METFVVTITAKAGSEDKVAEYYTSQQAEYEQAKGFRGRRIMQAKAGTMYAAVKERLTAEEIAKHPEPDHGDPKGVQFVIVEEWDSVDARMDFSMNRDKTREMGLFPLLEPAHTHEFYTDITP